MTKRISDIALAIVGLVLLSPIIAAAAFATLIDSGSPVLYRQTRMGRKFEPFTLFKIRTMDSSSNGPGVTTTDDPRVTRVGRMLRKAKIDETPQLVNVLRGDMSLVGPRPEIPRYVEMFRSDYETILSVRPGITDPASIKYRDESALFPPGVDPDRFYTEQILPDKIELAKDYVTTRTLRGDFRVLAETVLRVFTH